MASYGLSSFSLLNHAVAVIGCTVAQSNTAILTPNTPPAWHSIFVCNPTTIQPSPNLSIANLGGPDIGNCSNPRGQLYDVEPATLCLVENTILSQVTPKNWT